ncbi:MAG TPA: VOC family protein [Fimbriimonadaceae bacterium]|nr:VOC family protein [Fimbriimonadaceae bacterium]
MHVLESVLYAEDLEAARTFYTGLLGMPEISYDPARDLFLRCDHSVLIIFKASKTRINDAGVPPHGTDGAGHLAFSAFYDELEAWKRKLEAAGVEIVKEITWQNGAKSFYFKDPAGNILEFATPNLWGFDEPVAPPI